MSEAALEIEAGDPLLETEFMVEILRQMRALDTYGQYDGAGPETILDPFILTKERKREIPIVGDPDEITISRVKAFYNAIASLIEKECKLMAVPMVNLSHEGFGRVVITVGKLVVLDRSLRDVHRFGFPTLSKMKDEGDKYLSISLALVGKYSDVAGL